MPPTPSGGEAFSTSAAAPTVPDGPSPRTRLLIQTYPALWAEFMRLADVVAEQPADEPTAEWPRFYRLFEQLSQLAFPFAPAFVAAVEARQQIKAAAVEGGAS